MFWIFSSCRELQSPLEHLAVATSYFHVPNWELKSMKGRSPRKEGIKPPCSKWQSIQPTAHTHSRSRGNTWSTVESNLCDCSMCGCMNHLWLSKSISAFQFTKAWILDTYFLKTTEYMEILSGFPKYFFPRNLCICSLRPHQYQYSSNHWKKLGIARRRCWKIIGQRFKSLQ